MNFWREHPNARPAALTEYERHLEAERRRAGLLRSDLIAVEIALDELEAYVDTVGPEDEAHERLKWAVRKLRALVVRERVEGD